MKYSDTGEANFHLSLDLGQWLTIADQLPYFAVLLALTHVALYDLFPD